MRKSSKREKEKKKGEYFHRFLEKKGPRRALIRREDYFVTRNS
jgi:hypothetical protein